MKTLFSIVATLLVLAISGCAPQVDVETDKAAIRDLNDVQWLNAAQAKDVDTAVRRQCPAPYRECGIRIALVVR